jgi:hypothetical protein
VKLTHVILREIDGLFCYLWARDRLDEQTRVTNVELIIDGKSRFISREHHVMGAMMNRTREQEGFMAIKATHRKRGSPVTLVSRNAVYHTGRSE